MFHFTRSATVVALIAAATAGSVTADAHVVPVGDEPVQAGLVSSWRVDTRDCQHVLYVTADGKPVSPPTRYGAPCLD